MSETQKTWVWLAPNPKSSYRQLFVKGTRIRAEAIYALTVDGSETMTPEEVAGDLGLPLEAVREAVAYCAADPPEVREDRRREEARLAATGMSDPQYGGQPRPLTAQEIARLHHP
jgi:uncharacterized protein (DUF433 family)